MALSPTDLAERNAMVMQARDELYGTGNVVPFALALCDMAHNLIDPRAKETEATSISGEDAFLAASARALEDILAVRRQTVASLGQFTVSEHAED